MQINDFGPLYFASHDGLLGEAPCHRPDKGLLLTDADCTTLVADLPVWGLIHPRIEAALAGRGVYRLEDAAGLRVRVGQGWILQRLRTHLRNTQFRPARLVAAVSTREWSDAERLYLEARLAAESSAIGLELVSFVFGRNFRISSDTRDKLDQTLDRVWRLMTCASRLRTEGLRDEFAVTLAPPSRWNEMIRSLPRHNAYRAVTQGTPLYYEDGWIAASAIVTMHQVILEQDSLVYLHPGPRAGSLFAELHRHFLLEAGTVPINREVGQTTRLVGQPTAAGLIKRVTGGRVHNADRWRRDGDPPTLPAKPLEDEQP